MSNSAVGRFSGSWKVLIAYLTPPMTTSINDEKWEVPIDAT